MKLLDNAPNQGSKFISKHLVEINDESNVKVKFMWFNDAHILFKRIITVAGAETTNEVRETCNDKQIINK